MSSVPLKHFGDVQSYPKYVKYFNCVASSFGSPAWSRAHLSSVCWALLICIWCLASLLWLLWLPEGWMTQHNVKPNEVSYNSVTWFSFREFLRHALDFPILSQTSQGSRQVLWFSWALYNCSVKLRWWQLRRRKTSALALHCTVFIRIPRFFMIFSPGGQGV